jgi:hypothetical protein
MLGLGLLVRLGRQALAGPVADSGLLPVGFYRHLVLVALEEDDFPEALRYLEWARDPLLAQILVLRLRLLAAGHDRRRQALKELLRSEAPPPQQEACLALQVQEDLALKLLAGYESRALGLAAGSRVSGG